MPKIHDKETISELPVKPRRTKGTYSYKARNRFAASVLAVASIIGIGYTFLPSSNKIREFAKKNWFIESDFHKQRRSKLVPYTENNDLESTHGPVLFADNDSLAIRNAMALMDPQKIKADQ